MARSKRGRPRKQGKRYPSGDLIPATDRGTVELQFHRAIAAGGIPTLDAETGRVLPNTSAPPEDIIGHPLDALARFGGIAISWAEAGRWYGRLYRRIFPPATIASQAGRFGRVRGADDRADGDAGAEDHWWLANQRLMDAGPGGIILMPVFEVAVCATWTDGVRAAIDGRVSLLTRRVAERHGCLLRGLSILAGITPHTLKHAQRPTRSFVKVRQQALA